MAEGKEFDVIYWDTGNSWCDILLILPKECKTCRKKLKRIYKKLCREIEENDE